MSLKPHLGSCQKPTGDRSATTYLKPGTVSKEFVRLDRVSQYNAVGEKGLTNPRASPTLLAIRLRPGELP